MSAPRPQPHTRVACNAWVSRGKVTCNSRTAADLNSPSVSPRRQRSCCRSLQWPKIADMKTVVQRNVVSVTLIHLHICNWSENIDVLQCDGTRPACSNCSLRSRICVYETRRADESRITALRRENGELRTALAEAISIAAKVAPDSSIQLSSFHTAPVADSPRCKSEPTQSDHAPSLSIPSSSLSSELGSAEPSPLLASPPAPDQKYGQSEIFTLYSQSGDSATIASASLGLNDACHHQPEHSFESNANATLDECHTLLEALVRNSDQESTLLLASLRLGYSIKAIADHLERNGGSSKGLVPSQRQVWFVTSQEARSVDKQHCLTGPRGFLRALSKNHSISKLSPLSLRCIQAPTEWPSVSETLTIRSGCPWYSTARCGCIAAHILILAREAINTLVQATVSLYIPVFSPDLAI